MKLPVYLLSFSSALLLASCASQDNSPPEIQWVIAGINDVVPDSGKKKPDTALQVRLSASITDPDGEGDLKKIYARNKSTGSVRYFYLKKNKKDHSEISDDLQVPFFDAAFGMKKGQESIIRSGWTLYATDSKGHTAEAGFELPLPNLGKSSSKHFIFSQAYQGSREGGSATLSRATELHGWLDSRNRINIHYALKDHRAQHYVIYLFDEDRKSLGKIEDFRVNGQPLDNTGAPSELIFDKSEISWGPGIRKDIRTISYFKFAVVDGVDRMKEYAGLSDIDVSWWRYVSESDLVGLEHE